MSKVTDNYTGKVNIQQGTYNNFKISNWKLLDYNPTTRKVDMVLASGIQCNIDNSWGTITNTENGETKSGGKLFFNCVTRH